MNDTNDQVDKGSTRTIDGRVSSAKSAKTITVVIERQEQHGLYGKLLRRSRKLHAHDEKGECHEGDLQGPLKRVAARAIANAAAVPAKLSLDFGFAFGDYWIVEVGDDYEYAVVGHPTRDYLWILSRERSLPKSKLDGVLERAKNRGFPTGILTFTEQ